MRVKAFWVAFVVLCWGFACPDVEAKSIDPVFFTFEIEPAEQPSQDYIRATMIVHLESGWKILHPQDNNPMGIPPTTDAHNSVNLAECKVKWPQQVRDIRDGDRITLKIYPENFTQKSLLNLDIQFSVCKQECRFFQERLTLALPSLEQYRQGQTASPEESDNLPLLFVVFLGIVGGLILNFMPCVLPVLSLKLMQFTKRNEVSLATQKGQLVATILGIFFSFWFLAGMVYVLRYWGQEVGWGLHFQQPGFLMFMVVVMLLFGANLLGLFEFRLPAFIQRRPAGISHGFVGHFLLGLLATLLATPCSAPFLGTAVTYALMASTAVTFLVFTSMATGFSLPYILILMSPRFLKVMPKPGVWMIWLRRFMGLGLLGTSVWLGTIWYEIVYRDQEQRQSQIEKGWELFHDQKIDAYVGQGYGVFVDVTASWCVTCAANKRLVLRKEAVKKLFNDARIKRLRADWTRPSADISKYLNRHSRFGIPFNAYYSPKCPKGHLFPEILQAADIIEVITNKC